MMYNEQIADSLHETFTDVVDEYNEQHERDVITYLIRECHNIAVQHGFWAEGRNDGEAIALMHSELSEALEALRSGNPPSKKVAGYTQLEEEFADVLIRIFDFAGGRKLNLAGAILAKIRYNAIRPYKYGRRF